MALSCILAKIRLQWVSWRQTDVTACGGLLCRRIDLDLQLVHQLDETRCRVVVFGIRHLFMENHEFADRAKHVFRQCAAALPEHQVIRRLVQRNVAKQDGQIAMSYSERRLLIRLGLSYVNQHWA